MTFRERIQEGLEGKYTGLANGLDRTNKYIFNWQRSCYYLLGGLSGAAKTTLLDFMLLNAIDEADSKGINVNIFYYCLEISEDVKKANWLSVLIYRKYKKVVPPEAIRGLGDSRLTEEELAMVEDLLPKLESIWSRIFWTFNSINPTGLYKDVWKFMINRGTIEYENYQDEQGKTKQRIVRYTNNDPNEYNFIVADHIALFGRERGYDLKQNLDKLSEYLVTLRNTFHVTIAMLQQFNQGLNNFERQQFRGVDLSPAQNDFKDSSNPYQDADVVMGLMNAYKMQLDEYLGYDINKTSLGLKHRFRALKIIKNRLSRDDIMIGLLFHAEAGFFKELPEELTQEGYKWIAKL
jgi:replicative DNA helicase